MKLKKVELKGFKSFPEKTVFLLSPTITVIVGPNGCGKTNVFEGIVFALGEKEPKNLRGENWQDLIFAGNSRVRSSGFGDVSIYIENEQKEEIVIKRRVYRNGIMEYFWAGEKISIREFNERFYKLFPQGRGYAHFNYQDIETILTQAPQRVKKLLHSASEIELYQRKKETLKRRLFKIEREKERLTDILLEKEKRISNLEKEVEKAHIYWNLKEKLMQLQREKEALNAFYLKRELAKKENEILEKEKFLEIQIKKENEIDSNIKILKDKRENLLLKIRETQEENRNIEVDEMELVKKITSLEERKKGIQERRTGKEARLFSLKEKYEEAKEEEKKLFVPDEKIEISLEELIQKEKEQGELLKKQKEKYEILNAKFMNNIDLLKNYSIKQEQEKEKVKILTENCDNLKGKIEEIKGIREEKEREIKELHNKILEKRKVLDEKITELKERELKAREYEGNIVKAESERALPREVLSKYPFLFELFELKELASFKIFEDFLDAKVFENKGELLENKELLFEYGGEGIIKKQSEVEENYSFLKDKNLSHFVKETLKNIKTVKNLEDAVSLWEKEPQFSYLTEDGYFIRSSGAVKRYTSKKIQREKIIKETKKNLEKIKKITEELNRTIANMEQEIQRMERIKREKEQELIFLLKDLRTKEGELESKAEALNSKKIEIENFQKEIENFKRENIIIEKEILETNKAIENIEKEFQNTKSLKEKVENLKLLQEKAVYLNRIIFDTQKEIEFLREESQREISLVKEIEGELSNLEKEYSEIKIKKQKKEEEVQGMEKEVKKLEKEIEEANQNKENLREQKQKVKEEIIALSIKVEDIKEKLKDFSEDLNEPVNIRSLKKIEEEIESTNLRIMQFQDVNLAAEKEYQKEKEEIEEINRNLQDTESSLKKIEYALKILEESAQKTFFETLMSFRENLNKVANTLLEGKIIIELENPADPLNSNFIIKAQPSGKRLKHLILLSAGERSLVALSLIFALHLSKPAPFCILDEVDAALDDANTLKFVSLLKNLGTKTQFLVITHNKRTMEIADSLYGITMEEDGISKVLSMRLEKVGV